MKILRFFSLIFTCLTLLGLASCYAVQHESLESVLMSDLKQDQTALLKRVEACQAQYALIQGQTQYQGIFTPTPPPGDLGNFAVVSQGLYRGARPTARGQCLLKALGVKTVISLENLDDVVAWEKQNSEALGLQFISLPMSVFTPPTPEQVKTFMSLVRDPARQPVYFHCMQGSDRTGTMALIYRVTVDGWDFDRAYQEMQQHGFHEYLLSLQSFIRSYSQEKGKHIQ